MFHTDSQQLKEVNVFFPGNTFDVKHLQEEMNFLHLFFPSLLSTLYDKKTALRDVRHIDWKLHCVYF